MLLGPLLQGLLQGSNKLKTVDVSGYPHGRAEKAAC